MAGRVPDKPARIATLRRFASEFRRISKEYAVLDEILAERLRQLVGELEQEATDLEEGDSRRAHPDDSPHE